MDVEISRYTLFLYERWKWLGEKRIFSFAYLAKIIKSVPSTLSSLDRIFKTDTDNLWRTTSGNKCENVTQASRSKFSCLSLYLFLFRLRLSVSMWLYSSLPTNFSIITYIASCLSNVKLGRRVSGHKTTKLFAYSLYTVFYCFPILSLSVSGNLL